MNTMKKMLAVVIAVISIHSFVIAEQLDDVIKKIQTSDKDGVEKLLQGRTYTAAEYEKLVRAASNVVDEGEGWSTLNTVRMIGGGTVGMIGFIGSLFRTFTSKSTDPFFTGTDLFFLMVMCVGYAEGYMGYRSHNKHLQAKAIAKHLQEALEDARGAKTAAL